MLFDTHGSDINSLINFDFEDKYEENASRRVQLLWLFSTRNLWVVGNYVVCRKTYCRKYFHGCLLSLWLVSNASINLGMLVSILYWKTKNLWKKIPSKYRQQDLILYKLSFLLLSYAWQLPDLYFWTQSFQITYSVPWSHKLRYWRFPFTTTRCCYVCFWCIEWPL